MVYEGYCTVAQIGKRSLMSDAEITTQTAYLELAGTEASRMIDEKLRPFKSCAQTLILKADGYVNCMASDIGKAVLEDGVAKGDLISYVNTTRTWKVKGNWTFTADSTITISNGVGTGITSAASTDIEIKEPFIFYNIPLTAAYIPDIIKEICADIGAGLFKRRTKPELFDQGWLNQGYTKLAEFIRANWYQGTFKFSTTEAES